VQLPVRGGQIVEEILADGVAWLAHSPTFLESCFPVVFQFRRSPVYLFVDTARCPVVSRSEILGVRIQGLAIRTETPPAVRDG